MLSIYFGPVFLLLTLYALLDCCHCRAGIPTRSLADITQLRQKTRALLNPDPRSASPSGVTITSIAETLPSHRSSSGTAFVQDTRKTAFDSTSRKDLQSLIIKPTTELSKLGMQRFIEKLKEDEIDAQNSQDGFVDLISKPLAVVAPFVVAIAGKQLHVAMFRSSRDS